MTTLAGRGVSGDVRKLAIIREGPVLQKRLIGPLGKMGAILAYSSSA
jgi:hypothetical protein